MNQIFKQLSKSRMILYLVLTPLSVWTSVASSLVLQPVLDAGLAKDLPAFVRASAWGLILAVLDFVVYYFACTCRQRILAGYIRALRVRYFSFLLRQRPGRFLEQDTAAHLSKLTAEAETVGDKYCGSLLSLYRALWSLALSVAAIVSARWELAIVVVVFSLLTLNLPKPFQKQSDAAEAACLTASEAHMAEAQESIRGFLLIRLHGLAAVRTARYAKAAGELEERETARKQKFYAVDALSGAISSLSFVGIIVFAMGLVIQGKMSVGYVLSVSQLLGGVMLSFERLPGHLLSLRAGRALFRDSETAFREALEAGGSRKAALGPASRLELRDLSFSYRPDRPLLSHVDLTLETGKKYALVGASGSGKSTLAKLLMAFSRPAPGRSWRTACPWRRSKRRPSTARSPTRAKTWCFSRTPSETTSSWAGRSRTGTGSGSSVRPGWRRCCPRCPRGRRPSSAKTAATSPEARPSAWGLPGAWPTGRSLWSSTRWPPPWTTGTRRKSRRPSSPCRRPGC